MRPYLSASSPCMICHQHGDSMKKEKLRRMEDICHRNNLTGDGNSYHFNWGFNSHCRYGLPCPTLRQFDMDCERLAQRVEPLIAQLAKSGSPDYHQVLNLCRGDFPAVYNMLETIHRKE